jgi:hypothetical protein
MSIPPDMETTIMFSEFVLPSWTMVPDGAGQVLDASKLHSLQFQIANNPSDTAAMYGFCLQSLQWLDANGAPIAVGVPMDTAGTGGTGGGGMPATGGGMGGMPATGGGMGGMPATGGGMGGMPAAGGGMGGMPATGGMGGSGGSDVPSFAADIHPIMMAKCAPCHDETQMRAMRTHAQADVDAAYASATNMPQAIADAVSGGVMPPATSQNGALTQEEIDMIVAWVDGGTPE